jgi:pyruvate ferredoxin oxidoreductase gamma subunit
MDTYKLIYQNQRGFCNILISAIGGDGANMAAKLLFKIGVTSLGLDGAYDARYGSEKKGTPTDVSVRFCPLGTPVREVGPNNQPHVLAVFHVGLIKPLGLNKGLHKNATIIANTTQTPEEIRHEIKLNSGTIICLDATQIASKTKSRLNIPIMAVIAKVMDFPEDKVIQAIADTWPRAQKANLAAYQEAMQTSSKEYFSDDGLYKLVPPSISRGQIGYLNMLNGGAIDALHHSTGSRDNRITGYGFVPEFTPEACTGCAICMSVCSDPGGIIWKEGKVIGINTALCKGCMRCVEVCPVSKRGKALQLPAGMVEV